MSYYEPTPTATPLPPPGLPLPRAILAGVNIPFWDLVWLMVKAALAAVPAIMILALLGAAVAMTAPALLALIGLAH